MQIDFIDATSARSVGFNTLIDSFRAAHAKLPAIAEDMFLFQESETGAQPNCLLNRAAWSFGENIGVKIAASNILFDGDFSAITYSVFKVRDIPLKPLILLSRHSDTDETKISFSIPDYDYLISLIEKAAKNNNISLDYKYDWIKDKINHSNSMIEKDNILLCDFKKENGTFNTENSSEKPKIKISFGNNKYLSKG